MRKNIFTLLCCLLLTTSATLVYADSLETEIQLFEVVGIGDLVGDDPLGNPHQQDPIPPRPNVFHATISGRILEVSVDNSNLTTVIVRNAAGNTVVDDSFYALTSQQLSSAGRNVTPIKPIGDVTIAPTGRLTLSASERVILSDGVKDELGGRLIINQ